MHKRKKILKNFPFIFLNIAISIGSPKALSSVWLKLWQPNNISTISSSQSIQGINSSITFKFIIPKTLNSSVVKGPIRSKQQISIVPDDAILEGSLHTIHFDSKYDIHLYNNKDNSIGKSTGTIDVNIITILKIIG